MQQKDLVVGFSDLKDILIQTYKIEKPREQIRLYFSFVEEELTMHDYEDHAKAIVLLQAGEVRLQTGSFGWRLVNFVKGSRKPDALLNDLFQLYGFFRL